ncbi:MAG: cell division protein SepF [Oscillospiraceae bacterium]|nr:cell division protein SepF [Oscillospiraceae bacterium]
MGIIDGFRNFLNGGYNDDDEGDYAESNPPAEREVEVSRKEMNNNDRMYKINATAQLQVILIKPEVFSDTRMIADHLNEKKTVVLNLEATSPEITRRIIDFVGGVAYANDGNIKPLANNTFIIYPFNVNFEGEDLAAQLEDNGIVF